MKKRSSYELRNLFLEYFRQHQHTIEPGVPLVPKNDPSLLWINSGVSALKKYFDGTIKLDIPRIANSQRSIRTNDIENIGLTARHHTMFEMLGNFSIGDYFKEGAIKYAWEFLTSEDWIGFDVDKLYVTVYSTDDEAYHIWKDIIGLSEDRIFRLEGNFWEIGSGPSGPNSEIFYDRGLAYDPDNIGIKLLADDMDNDRYIEVWNLVFSQYNAEEDKDRSEYQELPQKNIDTGMGLERLASLVQGVETNFETDLFMPIIEATSKFASEKYEGEYKKAYKIIADHLRALVFALADGAMFSNEGRGYVLRRLLRRASRYGLDIGIEKPFLYQLVPVVINIMKDYYDYLIDHEQLVSKLVKGEEERFHKTLNSGLLLFNEVKNKVTNNIIS
ncbi:MAG: alanine--tRNA ligase, partial [Bacilli bacterium]|nr:alanine--tRNA ligase [Bacilli bacterium]